MASRLGTRPQPLPGPSRLPTSTLLRLSRGPRAFPPTPGTHRPVYPPPARAGATDARAGGMPATACPRMGMAGDTPQAPQHHRTPTLSTRVASECEPLQARGAREQRRPLAGPRGRPWPWPRPRPTLGKCLGTGGESRVQGRVPPHPRGSRPGPGHRQTAAKGGCPRPATRRASGEGLTRWARTPRGGLGPGCSHPPRTPRLLPVSRAPAIQQAPERLGPGSAPLTRRSSPCGGNWTAVLVRGGTRSRTRLMALESLWMPASS